MNAFVAPSKLETVVGTDQVRADQIVRGFRQSRRAPEGSAEHSTSASTSVTRRDLRAHEHPRARTRHRRLEVSEVELAAAPLQIVDGDAR